MRKFLLFTVLMLVVTANTWARMFIYEVNSKENASITLSNGLKTGHLSVDFINGESNKFEASENTATKEPVIKMRQNCCIQVTGSETTSISSITISYLGSYRTMSCEGLDENSYTINNDADSKTVTFTPTNVSALKIKQTGGENFEIRKIEINYEDSSPANVGNGTFSYKSGEIDKPTFRNNHYPYGVQSNDNAVSLSFSGEYTGFYTGTKSYRFFEYYIREGEERTNTVKMRGGKIKGTSDITEKSTLTITNNDKFKYAITKVELVCMEGKGTLKFNGEIKNTGNFTTETTISYTPANPNEDIIIENTGGDSYYIKEINVYYSRHIGISMITPAVTDELETDKTFDMVFALDELIEKPAGDLTAQVRRKVGTGEWGEPYNLEGGKYDETSNTIAFTSKTGLEYCTVYELTLPAGLVNVANKPEGTEDNSPILGNKKEVYILSAKKYPAPEFATSDLVVYREGQLKQEKDNYIRDNNTQVTFNGYTEDYDWNGTNDLYVKVYKPTADAKYGTPKIYYTTDGKDPNPDEAITETSSTQILDNTEAFIDKPSDGNRGYDLPLKATGIKLTETKTIKAMFVAGESNQYRSNIANSTFVLSKRDTYIVTGVKPQKGETANKVTPGACRYQEGYSLFVKNRNEYGQQTDNNNFIGRNITMSYGGDRFVKSDWFKTLNKTSDGRLGLTDFTSLGRIRVSDTDAYNEYATATKTEEKANAAGEADTNGDYYYYTVGLNTSGSDHLRGEFIHQKIASYDSKTELHKKTFYLPAYGSYYKFEPEADGVIEIYVNQQGGIPHKDGKYGHQGVLRRRAAYFYDEAGNSVEGVTYKTTSKADSEWNEVVQDALADAFKEETGTAVGNTKEHNTDIYNVYSLWLELNNIDANSSESNKGQGAIRLHVDPSKLYTWDKAQELDIETDEIKSDTIFYDECGFKYSPSLIDKIKKINYFGHTPTHDGFMMISEGMITYRFPVKAGKTYFVFGFRTKLGFCGYKFTADEGYYSQADKVEDITLDETMTNAEMQQEIASLTAKAANGTRHNVTIRRTFKTNAWTSLVLPFSVSSTQVERIFGKGTDIIHFNDLTDHSLNLLRHKHQMIVAGTPVFIRPTGKLDIDEDGNLKGETSVESIVSPRFTNVTFESADICPIADDHGYVCNATYGAQQDGIKPYSYFIATDNKFYQTTISKAIKGFRAWIESPSKEITSVRLNIGSINGNTEESGTTAIDITTATDLTPAGKQDNVYNLNGQIIRQGNSNVEGLAKGVYIMNGRKIVVK